MNADFAASNDCEEDRQELVAAIREAKLVPPKFAPEVTEAMISALLGNASASAGNATLTVTRKNIMIFFMGLLKIKIPAAIFFGNQVQK